jgi:putative hydrolase of the HAD superfamily
MAGTPSEMTAALRRQAAAGRLRALLLDALGTLVELQPPAPALRRELAARFGIDVSEAEAAAAIGAEIAYYRRHLDEGRDERSLLELRERCAVALRHALPPSPALALVPLEALTGALLAALRFRAFPDAEPALRAARGRGLRVVVVSNWDVSLHGVLAELGLAPLLDGAITSAQAGARKPEAAIFHRALELAGGIPPGEAVHVGDEPGEDVAGARAAGLHAVLLARSGLPPEAPAPAIADLRALADLLGPRRPRPA